MTAVPAGEVTAAASNTSISAETWIGNGISLQIVQINDVFNSCSYHLRNAVISTLCHIDAQSGEKIVYDAIAVLHNSCGYLQASEIDGN